MKVKIIIKNKQNDGVLSFCWFAFPKILLHQLKEIIPIDVCVGRFKEYYDFPVDEIRILKRDQV